MFYKYETHLHTSEVSKCASSGAEEMVRAFQKAGYAGIIVTDHFITENPRDYEGLTWPQQLDAFFRGYELARKAGDRLGLQVFFGWEMPSFPRCEDYLVYNLGKEFLLAHPETVRLSIEDFSLLVRQNGGLMVRAHPYREAPYIAKPARVNPDIIDGIEVNNGFSDDPENFNEKAWAYARSCPRLIRTAGTDIHKSQFAGVSGMAFPHRLRDICHFTESLRAGEGLLILDGKICDREGRPVPEAD